MHFLSYKTDFNGVNYIMHQYNSDCNVPINHGFNMFGEEIEMDSYESRYVCTCWTEESKTSA